MWHPRRRRLGRVKDPMDPVLRPELNRYGEMAWACYDAFDCDPSSRYCSNPCRVQSSLWSHIGLASKPITSPFRFDVVVGSENSSSAIGCRLSEYLWSVSKRCLYGPGELETEVSGSSSRFVVGFLCNRASVVSVFPCEEGCCVDELWRLDNALRSRFEKTEQRHRGDSRSNAATGLCTPHGNYGRKDEPIDKSKHWGDLEEEEQEEEMDEEELEDGMESFDTLSRHSLQLAQRHQMQLKQRKDSDRPLYQVGNPILIDVEQIAPGTVFGTTHTYLIKTGTQDNPGAKRASLSSLLLFDKFHYIYVESRIGSHWCLHPSGVEKKPKSSTTSTGDLGIGLEQLQLMSKVKNIASLQLYGEEQASGSSQCQYE
ncbi:LOW QUALITY PROTEIN: hypothetical protein HID58_001935 [Brassica napus]|uniref:Uncharacterized protein n=1 Tax=Brassica napus TaxID=3708 RepID=A0ABQ8EKV6_BRANA|nr:LOW QUALITY PROTEIN: hypothetical protein HID58_001935 [Brassica napus]